MNRHTVKATIVALLAVSLATSCSNSGNETPEQTMVTPPATTVTEAQESSSGSDFGVPTTDYLGRIVQTPANGEGQPLGELREATNTCADTDRAAKGVMLQGTQPITLWSEEDGPTAVETLVPIGYSKTAQGAALAAWNYFAMFLRDGETSQWFMENRAILNDEEKQVWERVGAGETNEYALDLIPPVAYKILSCEDNFVVLEIAKATPPAMQGTVETWSSLRFSVYWENNDWKLQFSTLGQSQGDIDSIEGWTRWAS